MESTVLTVVSVMFLLSLVGAFVLFKLLKSAALIQRAGYQAGGALAGFLLIFGTLYFSYDKLLQKDLDTERDRLKTALSDVEKLEKENKRLKEETKVDFWLISGRVTRENEARHESIDISMLPFSKSQLSESSGSFRFDNVRIIGDQWPELHFDADGYYTDQLVLGDGVADFDHDRMRIELKESFVLLKEVETTGTDLIDLAAGEQEGE